MPDNKFQSVNVPGYGDFEFPQGMSQDQMEPLIRQRIKDLGPPKFHAGVPTYGATKDYVPEGHMPRRPLADIYSEGIKNVPHEIAEHYRAGRDMSSEGVQDVHEGHEVKGTLKNLLGSFQSLMSPVSGTLRSTIGHPTNEAFGVPEGIAENAAMLLPIGRAASLVGSRTKLLDPVKRIFSPSTISPVAEDASNSIRAAGGQAARDTETTRAALAPHEAKVNALNPMGQLDFIGHVEGRSTGRPLFDQSLAPLADTMRDAYALRERKIAAMPKTAQMHFIEDYYPHHWKDPVAAGNAARTGGGASKQGSGASLHKRTIPTIEDGILAGLEPVTTNPIEATMRYVASMDRFIASMEVLEAGKAAGTIKYIRPKTMGASGHPDSYKVPPGYVPINGRGAVDASGARAHAPEDWARVYNNFIDRGVHAWSPELGSAYDVALKMSNSITALELGLSGFHAFTMANEAYVSNIAKGIQQIVGGKPFRGIGSIAASPLAPITRAIEGHKFEQIYLGRTPGAPDMRKIVDLTTEAGGRGVGSKHATDYQFSAMGSYWDSWKRGALKSELRADAIQSATQITGFPRVVLKHVGRSLSTISGPLFNKYIPKLKNGVVYDNLKVWLEAHPQASHAEQVAAARQIVDSVDNRFGEMIQDNIFWNKTMKQAAALGMRSYSWNLGTVREIGGGAMDLAGMKRGDELSHRAAYAIALPIAVGTLNAAYQYLKTGKPPESVHDLVAGRTGGEVSGVGGRGTVPERISLPGYQKDVFGWYNDWMQEAKNKMATGPRMVGELAANQNWRGDPIINPEHSAPQWLKEYFDYAGETLGSISVRQLMQGEKKGSNITTPEMLMGLRPAPAAIQDPEGHARFRHYFNDKRWRDKERHDTRTKSQYQGPTE